MTPVVLVHGGGFGASCWDLLTAHLDPPVLAVDLPGRGAHPAPLESVTIRSAAASVVEDINRAGFDEVVLAGHSLAGCSMPAMVGMLGARVRHAVFIACTVPEHGANCLSTLEPEIRDGAESAQDSDGTGMLSAETVRALFGNDLDEQQLAWCLDRIVPEAPALTTEPVDLTPLRGPMPRTWVRPLLDAIVDADKQLRFAINVGRCRMIDMDAAHMCMISQPKALARILNDIAASVPPGRG
jgi:pimeloyl-ACP methyl ester carboxylesterase